MMDYSNNVKKHIHIESSTGEIDNSFVGLRIIGDDIYIYHPESYPIEITEKSFSEDVLSLLNSFSLANTISSENGITYVGDSEGVFRLESYLWIIKDFLNCGFYVNREKVYGINQKGKTNWKRTYNQRPIVSNGNIIYKDLVNERKINTDNVIVEIHKYCVKKSLDFIGWLFNLSGNIIEPIKMNDNLKEYYLYVLQDELNNTFDDHKKELFKNMIFVLRGLDEYDKNEIINYGVDQYHYIFEKMIDKIFGNMRVKDFYPRGKWELKDFGLIDSSYLRPDTVLNHENSIYIIDSKYYRFGHTGDTNYLPETASIQKQIAYGEYAKKLHTDLEIYNVFIMPYNKNKNVFNYNNDLVYIGKAYSEVKNQKASYHYIYSFLIDLKHVIKAYSKFNHTQDISCLIKEISNNSIFA